MEAGFSEFSTRQLVRSGECLGTVTVISGDAQSVELIAAEDFSYALSRCEQPELVLSKPDFVYAPVVKGQEAGYAHVCIGGKPVGKVALVFGKTVEQEIIKKPSAWDKLFKGGKT